MLLRTDGFFIWLENLSKDSTSGNSKDDDAETAVVEPLREPLSTDKFNMLPDFLKTQAEQRCD